MGRECGNDDGSLSQCAWGVGRATSDGGVEGKVDRLTQHRSPAGIDARGQQDSQRDTLKCASADGPVEPGVPHVPHGRAALSPLLRDENPTLLPVLAAAAGARPLLWKEPCRHIRRTEGPGCGRPGPHRARANASGLLSITSLARREKRAAPNRHSIPGRRPNPRIPWSKSRPAASQLAVRILSPTAENMLAAVRRANFLTRRSERPAPVPASSSRDPPQTCFPAPNPPRLGDQTRSPTPLLLHPLTAGPTEAPC